MNRHRAGGVSSGKDAVRATLPNAEEATTSEPIEDPNRSRIRAEEAALLKRMQADDIDAFAAFFQRYRTPIYRTAYGLTGDPQAAEEILQDTFARAYQRRHILRPDVSPLPWLHRVALNLCYSRLGRRRLASEPMGEAVIGLVRDLAAEPAEHAEQQELRRIVRDGVAHLPPKHQSVVILYYLHGLSLQETAELLDVRLGTVKSRLHYALRSLRTRLEGDRRFGGAYSEVESLAPDSEEAVP
jgi:RNA polymerase sigma-70 factor (ECF subfamily)